MRIDEILEEQRPVFSFEFFPPKTEEGEQNLWAALEELKRDEPAFVSVTYGAGGSTRDRTIGIVKRIKREIGLEAMAHFTCVGATVDDLRGAPPEGQTEWTKTEGGLAYSTELAQLIAENYDFSIGAACFPEVHPEAADLESDLNFLKRKVEAGARFLITQLFFDNELYFDFVREARAVGIDVPIVPGIMPVTGYAQVKRFTERCGASLPDLYERELAARADDPDAVKDLGVAYATLQCADLLARGAPGIHFYTLNRSPATRAILAALRGARPWDRA